MSLATRMADSLTPPLWADYFNQGEISVIMGPDLPGRPSGANRDLCGPRRRADVMFTGEHRGGAKTAKGASCRRR